jgi:urate oxidase
MTILGFNRYGKAEVRLVRVTRGGDVDGGDLLRDWNISTSLSGDLTAVHLSGDNSNVLTTDAQKNTAYAFAQRLGGIEPEDFAVELAQHFVSSQEPITRARVSIEEFDWARSPLSPHSFVRQAQQTRLATVVLDQDAGTTIVGGLKDLIVMNTTNSEFWGFPRDKYTTLPETKDRILATQVQAQWRFRDAEVDWAAAYADALDALLTTFAQTYTYSLQQMLFIIGQNIIEAVPAICEVRMEMPNKHHFIVDLEPFGQPNDNEVYFAADRPYGLIEGSVLADDAPPEGLAWT